VDKQRFNDAKLQVGINVEKYFLGKDPRTKSQESGFNI
jgi:hypothetical protein